MNDKRRIRSAYAISTISVTLVLFLIGSALYFIANVNKATNLIIDNVKTTLVLKDGTTKKQLKEIESTLKGMKYVSKAEYISKDKALANFSEFIGEDIITSFEENPLPAVYEIYFSAEVNREFSIIAVEKAFIDKPYTDEFIKQTTQVDNIIKNLRDFNLLIVVFGTILMFISIILIKNTIRANILTKRFIIKTMLLIGATPWFIRRPFIGKAIIQGFVSSLIAFIMTICMIYLIKRTAPMVELISSYEMYIFIYLVITTVGIFICTTTTNSAVGKYIKSSNDNLHIY